MSLRIIRFESTPNPDAVKCVLDAPVFKTSRSYRSVDAAAADPLARALFEIQGVSGVFCLNDFITINRASGANWQAIRRGAKRVVAAHSDSGDPA